MAVRANSRGQARWGKTYKGFSQALTDAGKYMTKQGETIMARACEDWLQEVDSQWPRGARSESVNLNTGRHQRTYGAYSSGYRGGDHYFPWYTGNLHDSFATVVSNGGRAVSIRQMEPGASVLQNDGKNGTIDGAEWGLLVARRASHVLLPGIQAKLVIGVPYAEKVNDSPAHAGYVQEFERDFASTISTRFAEIKNLVVRTK